MTGHDEGTGWIGSVAGMAVFLAFLLLGAHVLVHLHARTIVATAASAAATTAASAQVDHQDAASVRAGRQLGEERARALLGANGAAAHFDWSGSSSDLVVVEVTVAGPRLLPPTLRRTLPAGDLQRRAAVHVEHFR
ncbi:MAG: hypothetical protein JJU45_19180 [Acidimicrobiia bacterium]|nr:hypothetical protein [Acidimicrobiia bacterium]